MESHRHFVRLAVRGKTRVEERIESVSWLHLIFPRWQLIPSCRFFNNSAYFYRSLIQQVLLSLCALVRRSLDSCAVFGRACEIRRYHSHFRIDTSPTFISQHSSRTRLSRDGSISANLAHQRSSLLLSRTTALTHYAALRSASCRPQRTSTEGKVPANLPPSPRGMSIDPRFAQLNAQSESQRHGEDHEGVCRAGQ